MTFRQWADNGWAIYRINLPERKIFRDTAFGPMWVTVPEEVNFTAEESTLVLDSLKECEEWFRKFCPGCQRPEIHKMCPAWGTPLYMSGELFTEEHEKQYAEQRQAAIEKMRKEGRNSLD